MAQKRSSASRKGLGDWVDDKVERKARWGAIVGHAHLVPTVRGDVGAGRHTAPRARVDVGGCVFVQPRIRPGFFASPAPALGRRVF